MKRTFLCNILLTSALIAICMASFTGCFHENIRKDTSHISETELKQLEGNAEDVVKAYFREKYDVQAAVTHQAIAGGVFLGPDSSAEQYYNGSFANVGVGENNAVSGRIKCVQHSEKFS